ncbi:MAG: class I SAM-dependent methyltransferase [Proteobacteria bacterium]|nr:class I SAM-dependent methyltransferase [Pseudomonadota bacterium]
MTAGPSPFFERHRDRVAHAAALGPVLDVASGRGRHAVPLARDGVPVVALDRRSEFLVELRRAAGPAAVATVRCDLEADASPPVAPSRWGAVLVFRYLHRPLCPALSELLCPGGLLLYETFLVDQAELEGGPRNPAFLLESGELPCLFPSLEIAAYHEGLHGGAATAQLLAQKPR